MNKFRQRKIILIGTAVFGLLVVLYGIGALRPMENFFAFLVKPLARRWYSWGTDWHRAYGERQEQAVLTEQVEDLTKEVARLTVASARQQELAMENSKLRSYLDFFSNRDFRTLLANIIAKGTTPNLNESSQGVLIDKGSAAGLRVGLAVANEEGAVIGKIVAVKDATAQVCLTVAPGCKLAAALQNTDKTQGITDGDLGLTIKMSYIPQSEKITSGDIVVSSGLGGDIPRGLVIGKVATVRSEKNEIWQEATIEPVGDINDLTVVSVIIP